ncbi:MAG TPA: hypothetical protein VKZ63_18775 [Kofleriaceae bacterium]|nr:hypothetical protein [Kofleriaceae bacterium]
MRTPLPLVALLVTSLAGAAAPGEADARPRRKRARPTAPAPKKDPPARPEAPEPPPAEEAAPDAPDGEATAQPEESAATGSSEQATAPAEAAEPPAGGDAVDVDALRRRYLELRDQLFRSRARAAAVASTLYSSKLRLHLHHASGRFYTINRATIRLDGASVFDDTQGAVSKDKAARWDGFVAPGRHLVTVRIEATGKDDQRFTTSLESSFVVQAPAGKDVVVTCTAEDDGDMAYRWQREEKGNYKLRLDVDVSTHKREGAGGARASR